MLAKLLPEIAAALAPLLVAALGYLAKLLADWIKTKVSNEAAEGILVRLTEASNVAVAEVLQTTVAAAKKAADGGKLSPEVAAAAKAAAVESLKSHLGPKGLQELMRVLGLHSEKQAEAVLERRVEAAVFNAKQQYPLTGNRIQQMTPAA